MKDWSVEAYTLDGRRAVVMRCGNGCCSVGVEAEERAEFLVELGRVVYELDGAQTDTAKLLMKGWQEAQQP